MPANMNMTLRSLGEAFHLPVTHDGEDRDEALVESEVMLWVPNSIGSLKSGDFSTVSGKWQSRQLYLLIKEHCVSDVGSASPPLSETSDDHSVELSAGVLARRISRCDNSRVVLEGKMSLFRREGSTPAQMKILEKKEVLLDELENVSRFEVPSKRSIPFDLSREELSAHMAAGNDEKIAKSSSLISAPTSPKAPRQSKEDSSTNSGFASMLEMSTSAVVDFSRAATEAVKKLASGRTVYTFGTIGMKWQHQGGTWTYIAFRSVNECFRWTSILRTIIVSQLRFQTFQEIPVDAPARVDTFARPDARPLVDFMMSLNLASKVHGTTDPLIPPSKGILTFSNRGKLNKWLVMLGKLSPGSTADGPKKGTLKCVKLGKTAVEVPRTLLLNVTLAHVDVQEINLSECQIVVTQPFSNQFFLQSKDPASGATIQLEAYAESLEKRHAWEEWLQKFGAVKVLSDQEREVERDLQGDAAEGDNVTDDDMALVGTMGSFTSSGQNLTVATRSGGGGGGRKGSFRSNVASPFSWCATTVSKDRSRRRSFHGSASRLSSNGSIVRGSSDSSIGSGGESGSGDNTGGRFSADLSRHPQVVHGYALPRALQVATDHADLDESSERFSQSSRSTSVGSLTPRGLEPVAAPHPTATAAGREPLLPLSLGEYRGGTVDVVDFSMGQDSPLPSPPQHNNIDEGELGGVGAAPSETNGSDEAIPQSPDLAGTSGSLPQQAVTASLPLDVSDAQSGSGEAAAGALPDARPPPLPMTCCEPAVVDDFSPVERALTRACSESVLRTGSTDESCLIDSPETPKRNGKALTAPADSSDSVPRALPSLAPGELRPRDAARSPKRVREAVADDPAAAVSRRETDSFTSAPSTVLAATSWGDGAAPPNPRGLQLPPALRERDVFHAAAAAEEATGAESAIASSPPSPPLNFPFYTDPRTPVVPRSAEEWKKELRDSLITIRPPGHRAASSGDSEDSDAETAPRVMNEGYNSEDESLLQLNPRLRGALMRNLKRQKECPLCGQDKSVASVCSKTGRKHAYVAQTISGSDRAPSATRLAGQRHVFSPPREPDEVLTARILLELDRQ